MEIQLEVDQETEMEVKHQIEEAVGVAEVCNSGGLGEGDILVLVLNKRHMNDNDTVIETRAESVKFVFTFNREWRRRQP